MPKGGQKKSSVGVDIVKEFTTMIQAAALTNDCEAMYIRQPQDFKHGTSYVCRSEIQ